MILLKGTLRMAIVKALKRAEWERRCSYSETKGQATAFELQLQDALDAIDRDERIELTP